jgi:hypothetical protein
MVSCLTGPTAATEPGGGPPALRWCYHQGARLSRAPQIRASHGEVALCVSPPGRNKWPGQALRSGENRPACHAMPGPLSR